MITELVQHQFYPESPFDLFTLRSQGSQIEIGEDLARVAAEHHGVSSTTDSISDSALREKRALLSRYCPALIDRAIGVSNYFGHSEELFDPYTLSLIQEAPSFACSVAFLGEKNDGLLLRNFDFTLRSFPELLGAPASGIRPMIDPVYLMTLEPQEGFRSITVVSTDLFVGAFDGINERGFCVALLALSNGTRQLTEPRYDAIDEITIPRILLERCETVEDAIALFSELPKQTLFIPCHYIVGDRNGNAAVLEWHETLGIGIARRESSQPLLCTNHYLSSLRDAVPEEDHEKESRQRLTTMEANLPQDSADNQGLWNAAEAVRSHAVGEDNVVIGGTLWTALYRTKLPNLDVRFLKQISNEGAMYSQTYSIRFDTSVDSGQ